MTKRNDQALAVHIAKQAPHLSASQCAEMAAKLLRHARRLHRLDEAACNRELTPRELAQVASTEKEVLAACSELGISVKFNGDPRGYPVKLHFTYEPDPARKPSNTWGGHEDGFGIG